MKNLLIVFLLLIGFTSFGQGNTFPTTGKVGSGTHTPVTQLEVKGPLTVSDSTYTGWWQAFLTANNQVSFYSSGVSTFMQIGPTNRIDFKGQQIIATSRGAELSADPVTGLTVALQTDKGNNFLNNTNGRTIVGPTTDDGVSQLQVIGAIKTDSFKMAAGSPGQVLTKNASGYYVPQTPSGGSSAIGRTYVPNLTYTSNISTWSVIQATYIVVDSIVDVTATFLIKPTGAGLMTFNFTLPVTTTVISQNACGNGMSDQQALPFGFGWVHIIGANSATYQVSITGTAWGNGYTMVRFKYRKQ